MLPDDDRKEFDSLDDFMGDRSLLDDAQPEKAQGEAPQERGFVTAEPDDTFESFDKFIAKEKRTWFPGMNSAQRKVAVAMILTLAVAGTAIGAFLFTQTLTPPAGVPAILTRNCDSQALSPTPPAVIIGTNGFVLWECTASQGAFTVNAAGSVTPTVPLNSPWTTNYIYFHTAPPTGTACSSSSHNKAIVSGSAVSFGSGDIGDWDYCSDYVSATNSMQPITYSWSQ